MPADWPPCPLSRRIRLHSWGKHVSIHWTHDTKKPDSQALHTCDWKISPQHHLPIFIHKYPQKTSSRQMFVCFLWGFAAYFGGKKWGKVTSPFNQSAWICHGGKNRRADEISGPSLVAARSASRDGNGFQRRSMSPLEDAGWFYWIRTEGTERIDKQWMIPANTCKESMTKTSSYTSYVPNRSVHNHPDHVSLAFIGLMCMRGSET